MISVSGKYWEEEKFNERIIEKIKIEKNFSDLIARQIISKKFNTEEIYSINNQLNLTNPFLKNNDFIKGVELLNDTINSNKRIFIIGDYDVDGCVSTSLIVKLLESTKSTFFYYIPNRFTDGYGSSLQLVKKIVIKKPDLVIMVDNGSSSNEAIDYLNKNMIKSIIIDHHEIYSPYPKASILINPKKRGNYNEYDYFCSGVLTYFFIDLLLKKRKSKLDFSKNLYLVLLSIISDVMPLRKINRNIANIVLSKIDIDEIYFFKKIFEIKKIQKPLEIDDLGFLFGPIINSAGRLDDPNIIVDLLTSKDKTSIDKIIKKLILLNEKRKKIEDLTIKKIDLKKIEKENEPIIIIKDNNIHEGLIGIISSKITNYFNKPSVIITKSENNYKGSARSINNFPIGKFIKKALDMKLLESGGGHNLAAGFTIKKINLEKFKEFLINSCNKKKKISKFTFLTKISLSALNKNFIFEYNKLKPYGASNLAPFFYIDEIKFIKTKIIKNRFISCLIKNKSGKALPAISFNFLESNLSQNIFNNKNEVGLIIQIKEKLWNGRKDIQVIIIDIIEPSNKA